ncbi:MAG: PilZ domain-containing protein [Pseudomonadota bacterium]
MLIRDSDRPPGGPRGRTQRKPRVFYGGQVAVKAPHSANDSAFVKDLSQSGIFLLSARKYLVGTELLLYLPLDLGQRHTLCMVPGKVVRVESQESDPKVQGYGVAFDSELALSSRKMLMDFVTLKTTGKLPEKKPKFSSRLSTHRD